MPRSLNDSIHLGVNIDHVATLRNARGENDPSLLEILFEVQEGGADSITMHLREDRRHILDDDIFEVKKHSKLPLNLEIALTQEMVDVALKLRPSSICLVPEKREEITTEGGLNVAKIRPALEKNMKHFKKEDIEVFLFVEPDEKAVILASEIGVSGVEIHTGNYAHAFKNRIQFSKEIKKIKRVAKLCLQKRLDFHAGHGLNYPNILPLLDIKNLTEVNIGHAIIAYSIKKGIKKAVCKMKEILQKA